MGSNTEPHLFVEAFSCLVSFPTVQDHFVAAKPFCLHFDVIEKRFSNMLSSAFLIDAKIIDKEGLFPFKEVR